MVDDIAAAGYGSAAFQLADFSSLAEVRRLAGAVGQECERLDILINNAGIGSGGSTEDRQVSQDGYELRFAVNYLAGFLLTRMLLPLIMLSKRARIVSVSSLGQHGRRHGRGPPPLAGTIEGGRTEISRPAQARLEGGQGRETNVRRSAPQAVPAHVGR